MGIHSEINRKMDGAYDLLSSLRKLREWPRLARLENAVKQHGGTLLVSEAYPNKVRLLVNFVTSLDGMAPDSDEARVALADVQEACGEFLGHLEPGAMETTGKPWGMYELELYELEAEIKLAVWVPWLPEGCVVEPGSEWTTKTTRVLCPVGAG